MAALLVNPVNHLSHTFRRHIHDGVVSCWIDDSDSLTLNVGGGHLPVANKDPEASLFTSATSQLITSAGRLTTQHNTLHLQPQPSRASPHPTCTMTPKTESTHHHHYYYLVPNLQALDTSAREVDPATYACVVQPTVIDDDDLTFGGKSLSTLYEEERRRLSASSDEEERRGRERVRSSRRRHGHGHGGGGGGGGGAKSHNK